MSCDLLQVKVWRSGSRDSSRSRGEGGREGGHGDSAVLYRHELQHFVDIMQGYITNQLFYLSWRELEDDLTSKVSPSLPPSPLSLHM